MASGGSRVGAGRPQDPNALRTDRRKDSNGLIILPSEGRAGDPPAWPAQDPELPNEFELSTWAQFWKKPQAIVWEQDQSFEQVALFIRQYIEGMARNSSAVNRQTVRAMLTDLLLTRAALKNAGYTIGDVETATPQQRVKRSTARSRLTVVPNGD